MEKIVENNKVNYKFREALIFVLGFVCLYALMSIGIKFLPDMVQEFFVSFTGGISVFVAKILGVSVDFDGNIITVAGFQMLVTLECAAVHYYGMFVAALISYPNHKISYKAIGIISGIMVLTLLNSFRIVSLGIIGSGMSRNWFDLIHAFLWQGMFVVVVIGLFYFWVRGGSKIREILLFALRGIVAGFLAALVINAAMDAYLSLLAAMSSSAISLFDMTLSAQGTYIVYELKGNWFNFPVSADIYDSIIFISLMGAGIGSIADVNVKYIKSFFIGLLCLSAVHLLYIVIVAALISASLSMDSISMVLWTMRGISLLLPVLLWVFLTRSTSRVLSTLKTE
jgi:exosortase/archaeosortase family protein